MPVTMRNYRADPLYGKDYQLMREFCLHLEDIHFPFGRWDWMISHSYLNPDDLVKIGIWEENGKIAGAAVFDTEIDGNCFFLLRKGYDFLRAEMILYAEQYLSNNGIVKLCIHNEDIYFQKEAMKAGYLPTEKKDHAAVFDISQCNMQYTLPEGYTITSMKDTYDLFRYGKILWNGFNHELHGEGPFVTTPLIMESLRKEFERPNVNLDLKIAVIAPNGDFAAYCGMWCDPASSIAVVEPVAADPAYRKMGLGKAVVLEAIKRCAFLHAKKAVVGSSQQFYYRIGFQPSSTSVFWTKKEK